MLELNVEKIKTRDTEEAKHFFEMLLPRMRLLVRKAGIPPTDADDVAQEIIMHIFSSVQKFDPNRGTSILNWSRAIAQNVITDHFRRRRQNIKMVEIEEEPRTLKGDIDMMMIVREALNVLPTDLRTILVLRNTEGFTIEEIAKQLGITKRETARKLDKAEEMFQSLVRGEPNLGR